MNQSIPCEIPSSQGIERVHGTEIMTLEVHLYLRPAPIGWCIADIVYFTLRDQNLQNEHHAVLKKYLKLAIETISSSDTFLLAL